ncbi:MAG: capsule biosynthesis protein [Deltaproteobacteria bacterium]|nr:capsule biosynthesis protein [Deltaproteobacteria bacterium]
MRLRGSEPEFLLCDSALPACMACEIGYLGRINEKNSLPLSRAFCGSCFPPAVEAMNRLGVKIHRFSEYLTKEEYQNAREVSRDLPLSQLQRFTYHGVAVGEHAFAGALRFYARGDLNETPLSEKVQRQYLEAAVITTHATTRLLQTEQFNCVVFNHGIYVPQGIIGEICRRKKVPVVNWSAAYRKHCFIFSHHDTYHHTMISEPVDNWMSIPWDEHRERVLAGYLKSRWSGDNDWIWFHEKPLHRVGAALTRLGVDPARPCIGMLTSVMWDAVLHYPSNAFANMLEWVFETIDYFKSRPELQLIIRIHPAEIQGGLPSQQHVLDEIRKRFPTGIPRNVFVIPPESKLSTYALMVKCNAVTIYNTKTGIELAAMGIPVIVAGEAWIRNKGFSKDVSNPEEYFRILDHLPLPHRMNESDILLAKKYAYHFFFRRMIPLEFMEPTGGNPPFRINLKSIDELKPGRSRGLDLICDGILNGTDFIFDQPTLEERLTLE